MSCAEKPYCTFALTVLAGAWLLLSVFVGETELLRTLPAPAIPLIIWSLVAVLLGAYWKNRPFRSFVDDLGTRTLLAVHLTRFVGCYFLYLSARGELPASFAFSAGWGDILVALGALLLILKPNRQAVLFWNCAGLIDILFVVFNAAAHLVRAPDSMDAFTHLPLSFLPTLVVPLIISTHVVFFFPVEKRISTATDPPAVSLRRRGDRFPSFNGTPSGACWAVNRGFT